MHEKRQVAGWFLTACLLFGVMLTGLGGFFAFPRVSDIVEGLSARTWPEAPGVVLSSEVIHGTGRVQGSDRHYYSTHVIYQYTVDGVVHEGDRVDFVRGLRSEAEAQAIVASLIPGQPVGVHYEATDPSRSMLRPGAEFRLGQLFIPVNFLVLGLATMSIAQFARSRRRRA